MCIGGSPSPAAPAAVAPLAPPPAAQVEKAPEMQASYKNKRTNAATDAGGKMTGGTLMTGPSGIDNSQLSTGKTLLGA